MAKPPKITILTDPIPLALYSNVETARRSARNLVDGLGLRKHPPSRILKYRGHSAVTRSLLDGLDKLGVHYRYNPWVLSETTDTVVVLSSVPALKQMIRYKAAGRIQRLLAGPNIVEFPSDSRGLLEHPLVDVCLTPSKWVSQAYEKDSPRLIGRCIEWAAGVDTNFWCPQSNRGRGILVFDKYRTDLERSLVDKTIKELKQLGPPVRHISYGNYTRESYRSILQESGVLVGFSASESQGIAWAEAWASGVPTLIMANTQIQHRGRDLAVSTAPYLSIETGEFFREENNLSQLVEVELEGGWGSRSPRSWAVQHMSDEVSAQRLLEIAL